MTRDEGFTFVPKWNEETSSRDSFDGRVKLYVMGTKKEHRDLCGPRAFAQMDPEKHPYKVMRSAITNVQLTRDGGAYPIVSALRAVLGAKPIQEAARLFRQLMGRRGLRPATGESMQKWTSRFECFVKRTRAPLHQADASIDADTFFILRFSNSCCWSAAR